MTAEALANLVKEMREAQREYFKHKGNLIQCKMLEQSVDRVINQILERPQANLFQERK